eukprot:8836422-Pyramimonas_sp.AAC.1
MGHAVWRCQPPSSPLIAARRQSSGALLRGRSREPGGGHSHGQQLRGVREGGHRRGKEGAGGVNRGFGLVNIRNEEEDRD